LERWQFTTGYNDWWGGFAGGDLNAALARLHAPTITAVLNNLDAVKTAEGDTALDRITAGNCSKEYETLQLIRAMRQMLWEMDPRCPDFSKRSDE